MTNVPCTDGNGRTGRLLINFELLKNNIPPIVLPKEERTKYVEFLRNKDIESLANWLRVLSENEKKRIECFKSNSQ